MGTQEHRPLQRRGHAESRIALGRRDAQRRAERRTRWPRERRLQLRLQRPAADRSELRLGRGGAYQGASLRRRQQVRIRRQQQRAESRRKPVPTTKTTTSRAAQRVWRQWCRSWLSGRRLSCGGGVLLARAGPAYSGSAYPAADTQAGSVPPAGGGDRRPSGAYPSGVPWSVPRGGQSAGRCISEQSPLSGRWRNGAGRTGHGRPVLSRHRSTTRQARRTCRGRCSPTRQHRLSTRQHRLHAPRRRRLPVPRPAERSGHRAVRDPYYRPGSTSDYLPGNNSQSPTGPTDRYDAPATATAPAYPAATQQ